jgi:hypothetical protein
VDSAGIIIFTPSGHLHHVGGAERYGIGERGVQIVRQSRVPVWFGECRVFVLRELEVARRRIGLAASARPAGRTPRTAART